MENLLRFIKSTRDRLLGSTNKSQQSKHNRNNSKKIEKKSDKNNNLTYTQALNAGKRINCNNNKNNTSQESIFFQDNKINLRDFSNSNNNDRNNLLRKRSVILPSRQDLRRSKISNPNCLMFGNNLRERLCDHIADTQWKDMFYKLQQKRRITGIVLIDPCFALTNFLPTPSFISAFNELSDFHSITQHDLNGQIVLNKPEHHQEWIKMLARSESEVIFTHLCSITELFDRFYVLLEDIERLSLHYFIIDWQVAEYCLNHFTSIASLSLENCIDIDEPTLQTFGRMHNLRHINLSNCSLSEEALTAFLNEATNLRSLNISNNVDLIGDFLTHRTIHNLERLDISHCWGISSDMIVAMAENGMPNLLEFNWNVGVSDESMNAVCERCTKLAHLRIDFSGFHKFSKFGKTKITQITFFALGKLSQLRDVYLAHTSNFGNEHLKVLISSNPKLRSLILRFRDESLLTDNCLERITEYCPDLSYFEAPHNHFIGGKCITELSKLQKLDTLILRGCLKLHNEHIRQLITNNSSLKTIILDGCIELDEVSANYMIRHANSYRSYARILISMLHTKLERSFLDENQKRLPINLTLRCSSHAQNKEHYNIYNGQTVSAYKLEDYKFWDGWY